MAVLKTFFGFLFWVPTMIGLLAIYIVSSLFHSMVYYPIVSLMLGHTRARFANKVNNFLLTCPAIKPGGPYILAREVEPEEPGVIGTGVSFYLSDTPIQTNRLIPNKTSLSWTYSDPDHIMIYDKQGSFIIENNSPLYMVNFFRSQTLKRNMKRLVRFAEDRSSHLVK